MADNNFKDAIDTAFESSNNELAEKLLYTFAEKG